MGRKLQYRPGSFYRTDDISGLVVRAEDSRKQWNGIYRAQKYWEPRQPQDLVRGVKDNQTVPDARPSPPPIWDGPLYLTLAETYFPGLGYFVPSTLSNLRIGDAVGIIGDNGEVFYTGITGFGYTGIIGALGTDDNKYIITNEGDYIAVNGTIADAITTYGTMNVSACSGNAFIAYRIPYIVQPEDVLGAEDGLVLVAENGVELGL